MYFCQLLLTVLKFIGEKIRVKICWPCKAWEKWSKQPSDKSKDDLRLRFQEEGKIQISLVLMSVKPSGKPGGQKKQN